MSKQDDILASIEKDDDPEKESTPEERGDFVKEDDEAEEEEKEEAEEAEGEEPEAEKEAAEEEEEEEPEDPRASGRGHKVPISRLNAVIGQRREAEARVKQLETELKQLQGGTAKGKSDPISEINDKLETLYEEVEEARLNGKAKDAAVLQRRIDALNREIGKYEASAIAVRSSLTAAYNAAYDAYVEEIEVKFPELNPDNEQLFDPGLASEIIELREAFQAKGVAPKVALQRALGYVFNDKYLETGTAHLYQKAPEKGKAKPKPADIVKKNLDVAKRQPANLEGTGRDGRSAKIDVERMSDEEFDKLPESTRARLRGDYVSR